jgi:hypothetical protein
MSVPAALLLLCLQVVYSSAAAGPEAVGYPNDASCGLVCFAAPGAWGARLLRSPGGVARANRLAPQAVHVSRPRHGIAMGKAPVVMSAMAPTSAGSMYCAAQAQGVRLAEACITNEVVAKLSARGFVVVEDAIPTAMVNDVLVGAQR